MPLERSKRIFGQTFECSCGRTHEITPHEVIYDERAAERVPEVCARYTKHPQAAVLADTRTRQAAGIAVVRALGEAGWKVGDIVVEDLPDGQSPVCDDLTKEALTARVRGARIVVSVGSGVISDLGKWVAFDAAIPFIAFATASSMNGYASANVAPTVQGVKTMVHARPPVAVLTSPTVLREAPYELTAAGLGDVLAKSVSSADWYLNHLLFNDYYCTEAVTLISEIAPTYLEHPADLRTPQGSTLEGLFEGLLLTGAGMTMAETTAPASGGEHLISHALDMMSSLDGSPHDLHGRQVGVGTILTAELYRRVLRIESPQWRDAPERIDSQFWGRLGPLLGRQYAQKVPRLRKARETLSQPNTWDHCRQAIASMLTAPEQIRDCLSLAHAAHTARDIAGEDIPEAQSRRRLLQAFLHAHEIRSRFTVLDLGYLTGLMPTAGSDIISTWV